MRTILHKAIATLKNFRPLAHVQQTSDTTSRCFKVIETLPLMRTENETITQGAWCIFHNQSTFATPVCWGVACTSAHLQCRARQLHYLQRVEESPRKQLRTTFEFCVYLCTPAMQGRTTASSAQSRSPMCVLSRESRTHIQFQHKPPCTGIQHNYKTPWFLETHSSRTLSKFTPSWPTAVMCFTPGVRRSSHIGAGSQ